MKSLLLDVHAALGHKVLALGGGAASLLEQHVRLDGSA